MKQFLYLIPVVLLVLFVVGRIVVGRATPPMPLSTSGSETLADCPDSPNCVSSFAPDDDDIHHIEPLLYEGEMTAAKQRIIAILSEMPRTTIETNDENYVHATQKSRSWGFIDDIELLFSEGQIDVRSAARTGYSDMGVNRNRIEQIRTQFDQ